MKTLARKAAGLALVVILGASTAGCDALNGAMKLVNCQISQLTVAEVLAMNQTAVQILREQNPGMEFAELTEAQAQAIINFLVANNVNCLSDLQALIETVQNGGEVNGLDELAMAFEGTTYDENEPGTIDAQELENLIAGVFSGQTGM